MNTGEKIRNVRLPVLLLLLCAVSLSGAAQTAVSGKVVDGEDGKPLSNVYVCLYSGYRVLAYTFTDPDGRFSLPAAHKEKKPDRLTASLLGYAPATVELDGKQGQLTVRLREQALELDQVRVTAPAVVRENDTVNYYADSFRDESDISLKQVLAKLPGVEVSKQGVIYHRGKAINKFYIEGLDMLGNRYQLATENLDPRKVAKIQVIENHQPVNALKGLATSDRSAVNIVLKADAKGAWVFSADAAGGYMEDTSAVAKGRLWLANFSKLRQSMLMLKANNTGETITDELRRMNWLGRQGIIIQAPGGGLEADFEGAFGIRRRTLEMPEEYYFDNMTGILSLNHLTVNRRGTQFRLGLQGAAERWQEGESSSQEIRFDDGSSLEIAESDERTDEKYYLDAGMSIESNGERSFITDEFSLSGQLRRHLSFLDAAVPHGQTYTLPSLKLNNELMSTVRISPTRALSVNSTTYATLNSHSYVLDGNTRQDARRADAVSENSVSATFRAGGFELNVCGGLDLGYHRRYSSLSGLTPALQAALDDNSSNRLNILSIAPQADLTVIRQWRSLKIQAYIPVGLEYLRIWDNGSAGNRFLPSMTPSMTLEWRMLPDLKATLDGSWSLTGGDADDLVTGYILKNYRSAVRTGVMPQREKWDIRLNLSYSSVLSRFSASLRGGYGGGTSNTSSSAVYYDELTLLSVLEELSTTRRAFGGAVLSKWFGMRTFSIELSAEYSQDWRTMFLQGDNTEYRSGMWTAGAKIETHPAEWLDLSASFTYTRSKVLNYDSEPVQSFLTEGRLTITPVKPFSVIGSVWHLYQIVPGTSVSNTPLAKVTAEYRLKKVRLFVECVNLLDAREMRRESLDTYSQWWNSFRMRPRSWTAGVRMSF